MLLLVIAMGAPLFAVMAMRCSVQILQLPKELTKAPPPPAVINGMSTVLLLPLISGSACHSSWFAAPALSIT